MLLAEVVGAVWSTVKWPELTGIKLLLVQPFEYDDVRKWNEHLPAREEGLVVADTLDAGVGDRVVIAFGHAARVAICPELGAGEAPPDPIDAAVVCVVDQVEIVEGA